MKITREFHPRDRYTYDFGLCSYEKGGRRSIWRRMRHISDHGPTRPG